MTEETIRVGKISAIYPEEGTARVVYEDKDNAVSPPLPFLFYEIYPYRIDDLVWVAKLSSNTAQGVILGIAFADDTPPAEGKEGIYRKDFSRSVGDAYFRYDPDGGMTLHCSGDLQIECSGSITATVGGDATVNGVSILHHTHDCPDGETTKPK